MPPLEALQCGLQDGLEAVIVDTAGRLQIDEQMMSELAEVPFRFRMCSGCIFPWHQSKPSHLRMCTVAYPPASSRARPLSPVHRYISPSINCHAEWSGAGA